LKEGPKIPKLTLEIPRNPPETISNRPGGPNDLALASTKSIKGPAEGSLEATILKAKLKAAAEKFDDSEPNFLEVEVPFTNVLRNLK
jgi:hypothetical protein